MDAITGQALAPTARCTHRNHRSPEDSRIWGLDRRRRCSHSYGNIEQGCAPDSRGSGGHDRARLCSSLASSHRLHRPPAVLELIVYQRQRLDPKGEDA